MKETKVTWESVKQQMAGLAPLTNASTWSFTPSIYSAIPTQYQPKFTIKQLTMLQAERVKTLMFNSADMSDEDKNKEYLSIVHSIFVKWENLYDLGTGNKIEYDGSAEMFSILPHSVFMKIYEEALVVAGIIPKKFFELTRE